MIINNIIGNELNINPCDFTERIDIYLTKEEDLSMLANFFGYIYQRAELVSYDKETVKMVKSEFININKVIPLYQDEDFIVVGISDIFNIEAIDKIKILLNKKIKIIYTSNEKIQRINGLVNNQLNEVIEIEEESKTQVLAEKDVLNAPVVRIVEGILNEAVARGASDIHIEPNEENIQIRLRIDGILYISSTLQMNILDSLSARIKVLSGLNISEKRHPQDGRMEKQVRNINYDFRVSILPTIYGEKIVIRVLDKKGFNFNIDNIGFNEKHKKIINGQLTKPYGIVLISGPTGCGKSTTLYSFINKIKTSEKNIITIEDPIEYTIKGINQIQINDKIGFSCTNILKSVLRQDPDVIMIGEIRDEETAKLAFRLAITGHLVLSTLHTNDAISAINRLINLGVEPYLVSSGLNGVISQRLIRKLCDECKEEYLSSDEEVRLLELESKVKLYKPKGCKLCNGTGYNGRAMAYEVLNISDEIKEIINKDAQKSKIKTRVQKEGFDAIDINAKKLVLEGITSTQEYLKILYSHN